MRLILIRHGQTPSNVENLLDTTVPGPGLTDLGVRQADAVPAGLARLSCRTRPGALFTSTQTRAQLTAAPLAAALGREPLIRAGLREISAGELEMRGDQDSVAAYLSVVRDWILGRRETRMPGGESGHEVLGRFDAVVREAEDLAAEQGAGPRNAGRRNDGGKNDGADVAIVSHGAMIRTWAACRAGNLDPAEPHRYPLSNTGVVVLERVAVPDTAERPWNVVAWHSDPIGGPELAAPRSDGPTDDADADSDAH